MINSLRVRLTLWYVLLLAITLALFSAAIYFAVRSALYETLDDSLEDRANLAESLIRMDDGFVPNDEIAIPGDPLEGENFTRIYNGDGELIFDNSGDLGVPESESAIARALLPRCDGCSHNSNTRHEDIGQGMRVLTQRVDGELGGFEAVRVVEVGLSEGDLHDTLNILFWTIVIAYPLALIGATAGVIFLAGRALSPIDRMTQVARRITAEDLGQRIGGPQSNDEVGRLARTFDEMIARLDDAFQRQRQFTADASHELRTPLTAIKGQTEVALQRERDTAGYQEVLRTVNAEVDRMIRLVASLLALARADSGEIPLSRENVALNELVGDAAEQIGPIAAEKQVTVEVDAPQPVRLSADQDLILQLLLNLLDNAVKYSPPGGTVRASVSTRDGQAEVRIADEGPGIAQEHQDRIFDRFYRADSARTRADGGAGLGLSISRWIVERHGGTIAVESTPGHGAAFIVRLPLS